jgi:TetR/AcrR family transcriptional regulator, regulator of cefoperazone and chloramphenicol sensitivity
MEAGPMTAKQQRKNAATHTRILKAAMEAFAKNGYREATVSEICRRARANIAAVNYYFGSKERLYVEALRQAFGQSIAAHPADGGVPDSAPAEERLRGYIRATVERMLDPKGREFDILHKEMANPTGLAGRIVRESVEPLHRRMRDIVREIIGPEVSEGPVEDCQRSIIAQCMHLLMPGRKHGRPPGLPRPKRIDPLAAAEHIFAFSLAGIREIGRRAAATSPPGEASVGG